MRFFNVRLGRDGTERTVRVPSPTSVQAGDAAAALAKPGETILSIEEAPVKRAISTVPVVKPIKVTAPNSVFALGSAFSK